MFVLDHRTLLVVTALISIGSAVALILLWKSQLKPNGAGFWAIGMSCASVASVLISGRDNIPDFLSIFVANLLYVIGLQLILRGIRLFSARPTLLWLDISLFSLTAFLLYYFYYIDPNINIRIMAVSATFFIICSVAVATLASEKNASWGTAGSAATSIFALFGIVHGVRGVVAMLSSSEQSFMNSSISSTIVILTGIFIVGGIAITLILLTYAVLESELSIFSQAVKQSASSIIITDNAGLITYVNPISTEKTGYAAEELIGQNPRILQSGEMPTENYTYLWESISAGKTWRGEFHNKKKNGDLFWEVASIAPVKQRDGKISHFVAVKEDISAIKEAKARIQHLAYHDPLTGLPSRERCMEHLLTALNIAQINATKVAVLFIDLDGFKHINDTFGHDIGDRLLKKTAERLCSCVRDTDTVARIGGDEFLILLTDITENDFIVEVTEQLIKVVAMPFNLAAIEMNISASVGIALYPEHAEDGQELVKQADFAMYEVKREGKNSYAFAQEINIPYLINSR